MVNTFVCLIPLPAWLSFVGETLGVVVAAVGDCDDGPAGVAAAERPAADGAVECEVLLQAAAHISMMETATAARARLITDSP